MDWMNLLKAIGTVSLCVACAIIVIAAMAKVVDLFITYANEAWFVALVLSLFVATCVIVAYLGMD